MREKFFVWVLIESNFCAPKKNCKIVSERNYFRLCSCESNKKIQAKVETFLLSAFSQSEGWKGARLSEKLFWKFKSRFELLSLWGCETKFCSTPPLLMFSLSSQSWNVFPPHVKLLWTKLISFSFGTTKDFNEARICLVKFALVGAWGHLQQFN